MKNKGLIHIYTGEGKGKTTAALGLALRACGHQRKVGIFQFLKNPEFPSGELEVLKEISDIEVTRFKETHPCFKSELKREKKEEYENKLKKQIGKDFNFIKKEVSCEKFDLVILDEILNVLKEGYLNEKEVLDFIISKPEELELILTGRGASERLIDIADYVTEARKIKHPFDKGIKARRGIEY